MRALTVRFLAYSVIIGLTGLSSAAGCSDATNTAVPGGGDAEADDQGDDDASAESDARASTDAGTKKKDGGTSTDDAGATASDAAGNQPIATNVPDGVGFLMVDFGGGRPLPQCTATLISPTRIVSSHTCFATRPYGGTVANNHFALAKDVNNSANWIEVTKSTDYKGRSLMELAQPLNGVAPVSLPAGPLVASDVGATFVTVHGVGADIDGSIPPGVTETLAGSTTVLRALGSGQPMKTVYPTFSGFVNAYTDVSFERSDYLTAGEYDTYSNPAPIWQRPLLGKYDMFTSGPNEAAIGGNDLSTRGAPLLRAKGQGYELVGVLYDPISAGSKTVTPYVLGAYYAALPADTIAMLKGNGASADNCGDIQEDKGVCRNGFALNCGVFGGTEIPFGTQAGLFCGQASQCVVKPFATDPQKSFSQCL